jgi:hypothetical protein
MAAATNVIIIDANDNDIDNDIDNDDASYTTLSSNFEETTNMMWTEKYRPINLDDVVRNDSMDESNNTTRKCNHVT